MADIDARGAALYSTIAYGSTTPLTPAAIATAFTAPTSLKMDTLGGTFTDIPKVREMPEVGVPASISSVAEFGKAVAPQISTQSEAPTLEFTMNYVPAEHSDLIALSGDGITRVFRMRISNSPIGVVTSASQINEVYWTGLIVAKLLTIGTGDASSLKITLTMDQEFTDPIAVTTV